MDSEIIGTQLNKPTDIFYDKKNKKIYIADSGNARVLELDSNFKLTRSIETFIEDGTEQAFFQPEGVFADGSGNLYIADPGLCAVIKIDGDGKLSQKIEAPDSSAVPDGFFFQPYKVCVDTRGVIYVLSKGSFMGVLQYDERNIFLGFFGSNTVIRTADALKDYFWRTIYSREQRKKMRRLVPIEISGMDIDIENFLYTTTTKEEFGQLKKLNTLGQNVMEQAENLRNRTGTVYADLKNFHDVTGGRDRGPAIIDADVDDEGYINILDSVSGRVFQYNDQSVLVSVFGGMGSFDGLFENPIALESIDNKIVVLDNTSSRITVFQPNDYIKSVRKALTLYKKGRNEEALKLWQEDINLRNANFNMSYVSMGKAYYQLGDYKRAMEYFKTAQARGLYSEAYSEYRKQQMGEYFIPIFAGIILLVGVAFYLLIWERPQKEPVMFSAVKSPCKYALLSCIRPKSAFEAIKPKARSMPFLITSLFIAGLWFVIEIISKRMTGFIFSNVDLSKFNGINVFITTTVLLSLWCVVNWAVCTLFDGKGHFCDIFVVSSFSLIPFLISKLVCVALSHVMTIEEAAFYGMVAVIGIIISLLVLICGLTEIHEYLVGKVLATGLITLVGIAVVLFLLVVLQSIIGQLYGFVSTLVKEIIIRK